METLRDLRSTWPYLLVKSVLVGMLFLTVHHVLSFTASTGAAVDRSLSAESEVDMYSVADTLVDPEEFWTFRQSSRSVCQLGAFYDGLQASPTMRHLSAFDQLVPVIGLRGDDRSRLGAADAGPRTGTRTLPARSVQMNRETFEFYGLEVSVGAPPAWDDVDYPSRRVPVLLGSGYDGLYEVGDTLQADLYSEQITLEVAGLLERGSSMYLRGEMNTFLDDSLVIPYPPALGDLGDDPFFTGILSFAMVNGDLAVPTDTPTDDVLAELRSISADTGFSDYALLGIPSYLVQLSLVRQLVHDNLALVLAIEAMIVVTVIGAGLAVSVALSRRRCRRDLVRWTLGHSPEALTRTLAAGWATGSALTLTVFAAGYSHLPNQSAVALSTLLLLVVYLVLDGLHQQLLLHRLIAGPNRKDAWHA